MNAESELEPLDTAQINSRESFVQFLNKLQADYQQHGKAWENQTLGDFLEALSRYAEDIDGYYSNLSRIGGESINADSASWRVFADMLRGATIYE
jgi:hypothetical protein